MGSGAGVLYIFCWASLFYVASSSVAAMTTTIQSDSYQYASDSYSVAHINLQSTYDSEHILITIHGFYESGPQGAWSFDPDPVRYLFHPDATTSVWFGRDQPLSYTRGGPIDAFSATGSIMAQNQTDALNPRVSGWVGLGLVKEFTPGWKLNVAYSPLFLPTFGPSLGFSDRGDLSPSRFARLPPEDANTDGVTVPIRYELQIGQLSQLLLQHQGLISVSHDDEKLNADFYAFTAPKPDPVPLTNATLAVGADAVNAHVDIDPQFPREYWSGTRWQFKDVLFQPAFEFVQNLKLLAQHTVSATGYWGEKLPATFGVLSHFGLDYDSPQSSDFMVFLRLPFQLSEKFIFRTLFETTLLQNRQGFYWANELEYFLRKNLSLIAGIRILSGEDDSYFGDWRNEDSYSLGVKCIF
jgi:hypothetical protein